MRGRQHPGGALAFLFENISAEISLTRQFRAKLAELAAIIQNLESAVVVFDSLGQLRLSNLAYAALWAETDVQATNVKGGSIIAASRSWQAACLTTPVWDDLRDYVVTFDRRERWTASIVRHTSDTLQCKVTPLPDSATMICFQISKPCESAQG